MSPELISILALVAMFAVATVLPVNMGVLAFVGAGIIGTTVAGLGTDEIIGTFPGDLFLTLVGITFLFAVAQNNGTIDWLVQMAVRVVRGRVAAIPWIMFLIAAILTAVGAVSPGAVAIVAPIALGFAAQYGISPLLMGLMVIHGAQAGGFSPSSIYGGITNGVVETAGLPLNQYVTMGASFAVNFVVSALLFAVLGGRKLLRQRVDTAGEPAGEAPLLPAEGAHVVVTSPQKGPQAYGDAEAQAMTEWRAEAEHAPDSLLDEHLSDPVPSGSRPHQALTVVGLLALAVATPVFDLSSAEVGFVAISIGAVLAVLQPHLQRSAAGQVTWPDRKS